MKRLIFAVAGYNLAETGRMLEIARAKAIGRVGRPGECRPVSL